MGVRWTKIFETSTTGYMPTSTANVWSEGINSGGGLVEMLQLRYDLTFAATPLANSEVSGLVDAYRVICNGQVVADFNAGYSDNDLAGPSQFGYLLNHVGGRVVEDPTSADPSNRVGYLNIPLGTNIPQGVNRWEIIVNWSAAAAAIVSGSMSYWLRYNPNAQTSTTIVPATSFTHAIGISQVVVRVPQNTPKGSVVSAVAIFNDSEADEYGTSGIRVNEISDFGIDISMLRSNNGDSQNGLMWNKGSTDVNDVQTFSTRLSGAILIPVFGLSGGDLILTVDSSAATTRRYVPILTAPISNGQSNSPVRQTQALVGNTAKATLEGTLS
tara:strand:+ start:3100 stop:4083 length:984 start_codon:yes stop_codon:yes gene_type:complete